MKSIEGRLPVGRRNHAPDLPRSGQASLLFRRLKSLAERIMAWKRPPAGWKALIARLASELHVDLDPSVVDAFGIYLDHLVAWGTRMDLTAARTAEELVDLSFADALVIARAECRRPGGAGARWVDVGSGGGAPGLPLFLLLREAWPGFRGALVEPRAKRVAFLRSCVGALGLADAVDVVRARSESLPSKAFDGAVARATLPPEDWLREGARLAEGAVWVLVAQAEAPSQPGWFIDRDEVYCWPWTGSPRRALRYVPGAQIPRS